MFATGFVLLALGLRTNFLESGEQCKTKIYQRMVNYGGRSSLIWKYLPIAGAKPSAEFSDLIDRMLRFEPYKRITLAGIKQHPWYVSADLPSAQELEQEVERVKNIIGGRINAWKQTSKIYPQRAHADHIRTLGGAGEAKRGIFDDDTEFVEFECDEFRDLLDTMFKQQTEERKFEKYSPEVFEWT